MFRTIVIFVFSTFIVTEAVGGIMIKYKKKEREIDRLGRRKSERERNRGRKRKNREATKGIVRQEEENEVEKEKER